MDRVEEVRLGRRIVRRGDFVQVLSRPGKRDGFEAVFVGADVTENGEPETIHVYGSKGDRAAQARALPASRVRAKNQTKNGRPKDSVAKQKVAKGRELSDASKARRTRR